MRRRDIIGLIGAAAAWPLAIQAQQAKRAPRVGLLLPEPADPSGDPILAALRDLGWIDGETIKIEYRSADGDDARLSALAVELVELKVDVLVTTASGVFAARRATAVIPIVVMTAPDLVAAGMAASLAHPGGNVTGQTFFLPQLVSKRLELLKAAAPSLARAGLVMFRGSPANSEIVRVASATAKTLMVTLQSIEVLGPGDFEDALQPSERMGGFVTTDHSIILFNAATMADIARMRGLPWVGAPICAARGGLMGYGVDFAALHRHAAIFVDKILKGEPPGDIPIEQATKFETVVNLKTATALGLEIPPAILAAADEVIE